MVTDGRYKLVTIHARQGRWTELFDLAEDPDELTDISGLARTAEIQRDLEAAIAGAMIDTTLP
ncbi:hypothetical protein [Microlunatus endophyticus]